MPRSLTTLALAAALAGLAGCGKVTEMATEKATEKYMESQINQNGGNAKVDLSQGGMTAEGTDEHGKAFKMEMGSAKLSEADVKIPFYPGATPAENSGTRIKNGGGEMVSIELVTSDAPKTVSTWYRDKLKSTAGEGRTVIDSAAEDNGMSLAISDPKSNEAATVNVSSDGDGSRITLIHTVSDKPQ
jgi:outer membrane lipopolysaccharide assembly protein LptE/RlpB